MEAEHVFLQHLLAIAAGITETSARTRNLGWTDADKNVCLQDAMTQQEKEEKSQVQEENAWAFS